MRLVGFTLVFMLVYAGGALAMAACGASSSPGQEGDRSLQGDFTLAQARAFDEFPLYWAGEHVDGLPLVAILRRNDTANYVSFVYGDCTPAAWDQGCAPPAEVQVWPGAARNAGLYESAQAGAPLPEKTTVRGRPAAFFDDGTRLEIFAGGATIVVFSHTRTRVLDIARALRCLAGPRAPPGEPLSC